MRNFYKSYKISATKAEITKRTARVIVILNRVFSIPLLVCLLEKLSPPPKAPPNSLPDCWSKIDIIRSTDNIICI